MTARPDVKQGNCRHLWPPFPSHSVTLSKLQPCPCPSLCRLDPGAPCTSTDARVPYVPYAAVFACGAHEHPLWMTSHPSSGAGIRRQLRVAMDTVIIRLATVFSETETYCVERVSFKHQGPLAFAPGPQTHISNILKDVLHLNDWHGMAWSGRARL